VANCPESWPRLDIHSQDAIVVERTQQPRVILPFPPKRDRTAAEQRRKMFAREKRKCTLDFKPQELRKQQRRKPAIDHQVRKSLHLARKIPIEMNLVRVEPQRRILKQQ